MSKFQKVEQSFSYRRYIQYWINVARNYDGICDNGNFFEVVLDCMGAEATTLLLDAFTSDELYGMAKIQSRRGMIDQCTNGSDLFKIAWNGDPSHKRIRAVLDGISEYLLSEVGHVEDPMEKRFAELVGLLKLSDLEAEIALFAYLHDENGFAWPRPCFSQSEQPLFVAMAIDRNYEEVCSALCVKGRLLNLGVLDRDFTFNIRAFGGYINGSEHAPLERHFYRVSRPDEALPWSYFGDLALRDGELLKRILAPGVGKCNVLLYGTPGTGKTSFARSLAKEVGRRGCEVVCESGMKDGDREAFIRIANGQMDGDDSLLIVDEADDFLLDSQSPGLFPMKHRRTEKGGVNMLLDEMRVPAIWISNVPAEEMDESIRRRFDYSVCFNPLCSSQRESVWRNQIAKLGLAGVIPESDIAKYSAEYNSSAGGISNVLQTIKRLNPQADEVNDLISRLMEPHCELMGVNGANRFLPANGYSLEGLNIKSKIGLDKVVKSARNYLDATYNSTSEDRPRMNILMFGPPGTGKTEFVKYMGMKLGSKVIVVKGSDTLGKYVGESEKNIAKVFRRAVAERAILFFDEIDGLVQSRESASHSWEVSQVNELLQQMESFDGMMIAATNFIENLDPAIMRRFTFKLEFDYLENEGKKQFFERFFKRTLTDDESRDLSEIPHLAPGDFRTVRQETFYLGDEQTNLDLIAALKTECDLKNDCKKIGKIGF